MKMIREVVVGYFKVHVNWIQQSRVWHEADFRRSMEFLTF